MTRRLYWEDDHCYSAEARVVGVAGNEIACDRTCFYAGGGGQPPDQGAIFLYGSERVAISSVRADSEAIVWHASDREFDADLVDQPVRMEIDIPRREALARYHTVLHVLNTIVLRDYSGWITGAQIGIDYSRIDFNLAGFSPAMREELEHKVNGVLEADHPIRAYTMAEAEFRERPDLLRTLEAHPPVIEGRVRVVEIEGFDAQACGGTHISSTAGLGRFAITKTENKGKQNKRLYVCLTV
jgi:misacylated tRNA(Ala) deacylase